MTAFSLTGATPKTALALPLPILLRLTQRSMAFPFLFPIPHGTNAKSGDVLNPCVARNLPGAFGLVQLCECTVFKSFQTICLEKSCFYGEKPGKGEHWGYVPIGKCRFRGRVIPFA